MSVAMKSTFECVAAGSTGTVVAGPALSVDVGEQHRIAPDCHGSVPQDRVVLGQMVARVAHDFNNLLTVIIGSTDLALQKRVLCDTNGEDLVRIKKATERATCLVRQLLAFSGAELEQRQSEKTSIV